VKRISLALLGLLLVSAGAQAAGKTGFYVGGGLGWSTIESDKTPDLLTDNDPCEGIVRAPNVGNNLPWTPNNVYDKWADGNNESLPCYNAFEGENRKLKENTLGYDFFVGWEFIPNWSVELRGIQFGSAEDNEVVNAPPADVKGGNTATISPSWAANEEISYRQESEIRGFDIAGRYHWMFSDKWGLNFVLGWAFLKNEYEQSAESIQFGPKVEFWEDFPDPGLNDNPWYVPNASVKRNVNDNGVLAGFGATINTTEKTFFRIEYTYYGVDFDSTFQSPRRLAMDIGYQF